MEQYKDKVAIVTGASSGIGAAIVSQLLGAGMKVVGLARRKEKIEELNNGYPNKLFAVQVDLTKSEDILSAFKWITENVGPLHVLINNAGIICNKTIFEADIHHWQKLIDTNLLGLAIATKEAIRIMKSHNINGSIININSIAGHYYLNMPGTTIYQASKFGVTAFTELTRLELAREGTKIRISSISPGLVDTEMILKYKNESKNEHEKYVQSSPILKSEDIANAVTYILSNPLNVQVTDLIIRPLGELL
ncbi:dehydrogenase/reductase sdr family member 11 [Holotrichia oblita]|uniref:Dehydrogenase/reductase sdr family member 11 n=2 Tax=Holotrichia oblita TaxID=644536 RepID=A0ACB9T527_HOLOL|nr:dehydrogenase/reductase sdr family member 11 [Holotrichia oblita]